MFEVFSRSLKHSWRYPHSPYGCAAHHQIELHVRIHNEETPRSELPRQTPGKIRIGIGDDVAEKLTVVRKAASKKQRCKVGPWESAYALGT